ncbi:3-oxoacyl-ACP synthase [Nocardia arthritidis]|uniref:3-oxoacyl-ACP synthase n=1 Tax=Nocardia arthritidis TaxID=228602 RepID=UPI00142E74E2|nr:3-oxoacyl-ACP synthase [Nocardia arthritidis]
MNVRVSVRGASYELGEHAVGYRGAHRFAEKIVSYEMLDDAETWGWGRYFKSDRDRAELAVASARRTLSMTGCAGADVDAVILCAAEFPSSVDCHASYCRVVLETLGLENAFVIGVTLGRCNTLLSAVHLADRLVASGTYDSVLVIVSDRITDEERRFQQFALFSDAAASCLVTAQPGDLAIVATGSALDPSAFDAMGRFSGRLGRVAADGITRRCGVRPDEISVVLPPNLFVPIVRMSEGQSGFRPDQLYLRNIANRGHCFSADPLVNLVDRQHADGTRPGEYVLLTSSVPGSRVSILAQVLDP